jgi:hypothetical protein
VLTCIRPARAVRRAAGAKLMDLEMLMMPGGRERMADEFRALFAQSGFEMTRIVPTKSPLDVIEAVPKA